MKTKLLFTSAILGVAAIAFLSLCSFGGGNSTQADDGQSAACGSPGEPGTCSRSGCHGAGNGNSTSGGLPDNAGPGSISFTTTPAMQWNDYIPNTTYTFNITIAEAGRPRFGFACEMIDNSGNTNFGNNNTLGTVIVSDPANTKTWQPFGNGRLAITHRSGAGYTTGSHTYQFQWTAPAAGIVNMYLCGTAVNNDMQPDAADNVYTLHTQFYPFVTGENENKLSVMNLNLFPNPVRDQLNLAFELREEKNIVAEIYSVDGQRVKELINETVSPGHFAESYPIDDLAKGVYVLKISDGENVEAKRIIVE